MYARVEGTFLYNLGCMTLAAAWPRGTDFLGGGLFVKKLKLTGCIEQKKSSDDLDQIL